MLININDQRAKINGINDRSIVCLIGLAIVAQGKHRGNRSPGDFSGPPRWIGFMDSLKERKCV